MHITIMIIYYSNNSCILQYQSEITIRIEYYNTNYILQNQSDITIMIIYNKYQSQMIKIPIIYYDNNSIKLYNTKTIQYQTYITIPITFTKQSILS